MNSWDHVMHVVRYWFSLVKTYDRYNEAEAFGIDFGYYENCNKLCTKNKEVYYLA